MTINVPYELGDPIIKIEYNQHDGYYIEYDGFCYSDIENLDMIFSNYKQAKMKLDQLNSKGNKK